MTANGMNFFRGRRMLLLQADVSIKCRDCQHRSLVLGQCLSGYNEVLQTVWALGSMSVVRQKYSVALM
jgi:hypothetical protein